MTDRRPGFAPVITAAVALFCLVLLYLALQVRAGADPAIGAGPPARATAQAPQQVLVRRIVVRRVVEDAPAASAPPPSSAPAGGPPRPAPRAAAPVAAATAPATAPAPSPVVTRAS